MLSHLNYSTPLRLAAGGLALALLASACGDDSSDNDTSTDGAEAGDGQGVTVQHAFGETTVDETPERIVSLNVQWTDVLLALDVEPVGYLVDEGAGEDGPYPWQEGQLEESTELVMSGSVPYEQIAALDPDLILVTYVASEQEIFDTLSEIAPTIGVLDESMIVDPWQDLAIVAGDVLDQPEQAADLVTEIEDFMSEAAEDMPHLEGGTFSLVNYVPGDSLWVVADPEDGASVFFQQLGLELNPGLNGVAEVDTGRMQLSFEQVDLLDSDLLLILTGGGEPDDLPGYSDLPAVTSGGVAELDFKTAVGLNTPTPLSIPYVFDELRPALEAVDVD